MLFVCFLLLFVSFREGGGCKVLVYAKEVNKSSVLILAVFSSESCAPALLGLVKLMFLMIFGSVCILWVGF